MENHRGDRFGFLLRGTREVLTIPFEISDGIVIPPGHYDFDSYRLELQLAGERTLAPRADINKGDFYDGTWLQVDAAVEWRPSSRWYFSTGTDGAPEPRCCRARSGPTYRCTYFLTVAAPTSAPKISPEPLAASP